MLLRAVLAVVGVFLVLYGARDIALRISRFTSEPKAQITVVQQTTLPKTGENPHPTFVASAEAMIPVRLEVSSVGINAKVESVGTDGNGAMKTPSSFSTVAWYSKGSKPGEPGNAVIAGHVNNALTKAGVFEYLSSVSVGDIVTVTDESGRQLRYAVRDIEEYPTDDAPTDIIFARSGPSQLALITCAGDWDAKAHSFNQRLVVFAELLAQ